MPIRLGDIQGPLDNAALIFGHTAFLEALITAPREVHRLLDMITDLMIEFASTQRESSARPAPSSSRAPSSPGFRTAAASRSPTTWP